MKWFREENLSLLINTTSGNPAVGSGSEALQELYTVPPVEESDNELMDFPSRYDDVTNIIPNTKCSGLV